VNERYTLRVEKDALVFSAGHFITFDNGDCERLHGHNYRVAVEVTGLLGDAGYVFDFIALRDRMLEVVLELDHRMLIPTGNPHFRITRDAASLELKWRHKRYVFPLEDCAVLDIPNTTTELLAKHLGQELSTRLKRQHSYVPQSITIELEENFGQRARCELCLRVVQATGP
jgi:6-pyruvoyltetrahydropterin/6-carboxytetrahydropterin synthase